MIRSAEAESHICAGPHRTPRLRIARGVRLHRTAHGELRRTAYGGRIPLRFDAPIVHKRRILLRPRTEHPRATQQNEQHETTERTKTERQTEEGKSRHGVSSNNYIVGKVNTNVPNDKICDRGFAFRALTSVLFVLFACRSYFRPHIPLSSLPSRCVTAPKPLFVFKIPPFSSSLFPTFLPHSDLPSLHLHDFRKKVVDFLQKTGKNQRKTVDFFDGSDASSSAAVQPACQSRASRTKAPHRHKKIGNHTRTNMCDRRKFLRIFRPTCRLQAGNRRVGNESREPQPRIMVRSILKRTLALSAWGTPAGIMSISPAATL